MRALLALCALAVIVAAACSPPPSIARQGAPGRLMVSADEYSLVLSRRTINHGRVTIQFVNRGEDPHNLRIRKIRSHRRRIALPEIGPNRIVETNKALTRGRYRLWCSLPGHAKLGMRARLTVR